MNVKEETKGNSETSKPNDSLPKVLLPVTFKVKDKEFRASKDVLISASTYFEKMFTNGMKESSSDIVSIITTSNVETICYYANKYQIENLKM